MPARSQSPFLPPDPDSGRVREAVDLIVDLVVGKAELRVISERGAAHLVAPEPPLPDLAEELRDHLPQILDALRGRPCDVCLEEETKGRLVIACGRCGYSGVRL